MSLFGVQLLLLDWIIPAYSREWLIISFYWYKGQSSIEFINEIVKMCWRTGYEDGKPIPEKYPMDYFKRMPLNNQFVASVVNKIKDDDIYS